MEVIVIYKRGFFFKLLDEYEDVVGWRLIHRETAYGGLLAPILGIGSQFLVVALTLLGALLCHQVHPAKPSSLLTCGVTIFLLTGFIGGFSSARIYKTFRGKSWLLNAFLTATMVPGGIMVLISALSFMAWSQQSSLAISFNGWIMVAVLWMAVLLPGIVMGSHTGNQRDPIEHPVRPTQMPRIIPGKRWYQTYTARRTVLVFPIR
ncbi:uncharacterized protein BYT42DRAFT_131169 [Radiomyces spectabilis]|uniref:uncharacterized protein n=1 Tax=Radiomyces spectabilis TaxID=64574 RepID=UPI002221087E|nr:uncharacterized protein BYT42DRAFT_131169 [Radiomyces spectabilis]KAI8367566.1 hypothetical protein BYT42DRAFT_131169 [Radiomyces spectabilis]